ncbi:MAG: tyrosine-type recombinase/integrase [Aureispira sp.]
MKKQKLKNRHYKSLLEGFTTWLTTLGYSASTVYNLPNFVQGFLYYQEEQKRSLANWEGGHFRRYMEQTRARKNERKAGSLSSAHINKIAHSLELFQRYLLQTNEGEQYTTLKRLANSSKPLEIFSQAQIKELYNTCPKTLIGIRQRAMLGLCYGCGLRSSEACNLELKDIWWDRELLQVRHSKTKQSRLVPIASPVLEDLYFYAQEVRPLLQENSDLSYYLLTLRGGKMSHQTLYRSFQRLLEQLEYPLTGLHSLRHSIASHLAQSGMPSEQIAQLLGHKTLDSTQIYVHFINEKS